MASSVGEHPSATPPVGAQARVAVQDGVQAVQTKARAAKRWPLFVAAREHAKGKSSLFAAAVSFFAALSLAPLLVLAVAMVGTVFGNEATRAQLVEDIDAAMGPAPAAVVDGLVRNAALDEGRWWRVVVGVVVAAWGATGLFVRLQETLNTVWGVRQREGRTLRERVVVLLRKRLTSFMLIGIVGVLLFASMVLQSFGAGLDALASELPFGTWTWRVAQGLVAIALCTAFLMPVYRILPDVELAWRDVLPGALVAAVIATVGAALLGFYFGYAATRSLSGAAGGVLLLLLWMYFEAHVLLFGARYTRACVARRPGPIVPERHAQLVEPTS